MSQAPSGPIPEPIRSTNQERPIDRQMKPIRQRLINEATSAVGMLESALRALWNLDVESAEEILRRDAGIDEEEVAIEEASLRMLALQQPVARDLRELALVVKANADIERIADHACSIAKVARKLAGKQLPEWPTALLEMGQRVPIACHALLRAMVSSDVDAAKQVVAGDKTIDAIHRQLFSETVAMMKRRPGSEEFGLLVYRVGRDLERVGDMLTNIAEDIVFFVTGEIIRHEKKRIREELAAGGASD